MTLCERVFEDLKAYLDGELGWGASWTVRRHLAACPGCRQEMEEMRALQTRLRSADAGELPPALRARILAVCADVEPAPAARKPSHGFFSQPRLAWGTVAAVGLLTIAILSGPMTNWSHPAIRFPASGNDEAAAPAAKAALANSGVSGGASLKKSVAQPDANHLAEVNGPAAPVAPKIRSPLASVVPGGNGSMTIDRHPATSSRGVERPMSVGRETKTEAAPAPGSEARLGKPDSGIARFAATAAPASPQLHYDAPAVSSLSSEQKAPVELLLLVDNVAERSANIRATAKSFGGEVAPTNLGFVAANAENLTIDVPVDKFTETVAEIKKQGDFVAKTLPEAERLLATRQYKPGETTLGLSADAGTRSRSLRDERKEKTLNTGAGLSDLARGGLAGADNAAAKRVDALSEPRGAAGPTPDLKANKPVGGRETERIASGNGPAQNGGGRAGPQGPAGGLGGGGGFGVGAFGGGLNSQPKQQENQDAARRNQATSQITREKKDETRRPQDSEQVNKQQGVRSQPQTYGRAGKGQVQEGIQTPALNQVDQLKLQKDKQPQSGYFYRKENNLDRANRRDAYTRIIVKLRQKQNSAPDTSKKP